MNINNTDKTIIVRSGLKATRSRIAVLHILEEKNKPLDVAEIIIGLKKHSIRADQATVYRIVDSFFKKGLVSRLNFQEGKFRYEKTGTGEHHHLICESCGKTEDISDCNIVEFQENTARKKGFLIKRHSLEFFGLCKSCQ